MENPCINIEVIYASVDAHRCLPLKVSPTTTINQAIQHSGILTLFPEIDLQQNKVGIFGEIKSLDTIVEAGDRIEIYRPIHINPILERNKQVRSERLAKKNKPKPLRFRSQNLAR